MAKKKNDDNQIYSSYSIIINKSQNALFNYLDKLSCDAKILKNKAIFNYRQLITASQKGFIKLHPNEKEVLGNFELSIDDINTIRESNKKSPFKAISDKYYFPSYEHMEALFKVFKDDTYYKMPVQSAQAVIKNAHKDFKSWFEISKEYKSNPSKYKGKPKMPNYIKGDKTTFSITNQDAVIKETVNKKGIKQYGLKLPKTKIVLQLGSILPEGKFMEVKVVPYYNMFKIELVFSKEFTFIERKPNRIIGIDLGLTNFATISNNIGLSPMLIKGTVIKSKNQLFNKSLAKFKSELPKGIYGSNKIDKMFKNRDLFNRDYYHKVSAYIIKYCLLNNIDTIVVGKNKQWKTDINIGRVNNQNFVSIAHNTFIEMLKYKAFKNHIKVIENEESYTSKASFLDNDSIPTYGEIVTKPTFSGRRIKRGLYKSKDKTIINADINGASNIIKKDFKDAFNIIKDFKYLLSPIVVNYSNL